MILEAQERENQQKSSANNPNENQDESQDAADMQNYQKYFEELGLDGTEATMMMGLLDYEKILFDDTDANHASAVEALTEHAMVPAIEQIESIRQKLLAADNVATELLEVITIGEIIMNLPVGDKAVAFLDMIKRICMREDSNAELSLIELEKVLKYLRATDGTNLMILEAQERENQQKSSANNPNENQDESQDAADAQNYQKYFEELGLDGTEATMMMGLLDYEKILFDDTDANHASAVEALTEQ